jgi:hypothetical protein
VECWLVARLLVGGPNAVNRNGAETNGSGLRW